MISVSDIKSTLSITSSGADALIAQVLNDATQYVASTCSIDASGNITERGVVMYDGSIRLRSRANDITVASVVTFDALGTATTATSADYWFDNQATIRFINYPATGDRFKVTYTSDQVEAAMDEVIRKVTLYEFLRLPGLYGKGFLTQEAMGAGDLTQTYKTPESFYADIDRRLRSIFILGI